MSTSIENIANPYGTPAAHPTGSANAMQARESAEVMAMAMMAKRFPRDVIRASDRIRNAFTRTTLAESAQYQFARGGTDITGPSIRAAEAMSQQWGNMSNGWREVSRTVDADGVGVSEIEAYCIDYESTTRESITFLIRHWRDTKRGGYALKDERDIYELCANQAQRRKRACILAQIPGDVVEMAMDQSALTLRSKVDVTPEGVKRLLEAFGEYGVSKEQIEKRIQRRMESIMPAQVVSLKRVYASLRDDMSTPADWFDVSAGDETIDPQTGEIKPKAKATFTDATPRDKPKPRSYAQLVELCDKATSEDTALLLLDEAREYLPEDQQADLLAFIKGKAWKGGKK
jgi:hypothetical protein